MCNVLGITDWCSYSWVKSSITSALARCSFSDRTSSISISNKGSQTTLSARSLLGQPERRSSHKLTHNPTTLVSLHYNFIKKRLQYTCHRTTTLSTLRPYVLHDSILLVYVLTVHAIKNIIKKFSVDVQSQYPVCAAHTFLFTNDNQLTIRRGFKIFWEERLWKACTILRIKFIKNQQ